MESEDGKDFRHLSLIYMIGKRAIDSLIELT
jgi:hypothetical protein